MAAMNPYISQSGFADVVYSTFLFLSIMSDSIYLNRYKLYVIFGIPTGVEVGS